MTITFIFGGVRCGKSAYAERLADQSGRPKLYLATAEALDGEMRERIAAHKARRGDGWATLEEPIAIAQAIIAQPGKFIMVDCLTLWLSNLLQRKLDVAAHTSALEDALRTAKAEVTLVSNEVGLGVMPENALARQFADLAGMLHQRVAMIADRVVWMAAGIPTHIKGQP